jgi:hypothetical protein
MATIARVKTWASLEILTASDLNSEYNNIVNYLNNADAGSTTWSRVLVTNSSAIPLVVNNSTGSVDIANFQANGANKFRLDSVGAATFASTLAITGAATLSSTLDVTGTIKEATNRVFSKSSIFTTSGAFPTAAGVTNYAHGFAAVPSLYLITIKNTSAELGYSINDEVHFAGDIYPGTTGNRFTHGVDATNVFLLSEGAGSTSILRKDTQAIATITKASWNVVVRAWA